MYSRRLRCEIILEKGHDRRHCRVFAHPALLSSETIDLMDISPESIPEMIKRHSEFIDVRDLGPEQSVSQDRKKDTVEIIQAVGSSES